MRQNDRSGRIADAILRFRRSRAELLPAELFSDHPWDFLLELFVADANGQRLTGRDVSQRNGIGERAAAAWLRHLSKAGLIVGDGDGDLDDALTLSGEAMARIERLLEGDHSLPESIVPIDPRVL